MLTVLTSIDIPDSIKDTLFMHSPSDNAGADAVKIGVIHPAEWWGVINDHAIISIHKLVIVKKSSPQLTVGQLSANRWPTFYRHWPTACQQSADRFFQGLRMYAFKRWTYSAYVESLLKWLETKQKTKHVESTVCQLLANRLFQGALHFYQ